MNSEAFPIRSVTETKSKASYFAAFGPWPMTMTSTPRDVSSRASVNT